MVDGHIRLLTLDFGGCLSWLVVTADKATGVELLRHLLVGRLVLLDLLPGVFMRRWLRTLVRLKFGGSVHCQGAA